MQRLGVRFTVMAALVAVAASGNAQDWGNLAVISSTMGNYAGRICVGEGLRVGDIGCPTYAPSVTTAGDVSVTGNLSANKFIGDGSLLTGISNASGDRIVSGTLAMVANSTTSYVSLSTNGTTWGYFSGSANYLPSLDVGNVGRILSANISVASSGKGLELRFISNTDRAYITSYDRGASAYKPLSIDSSYFSVDISGAEKFRVDSNGNVGIGTVFPSALLSVQPASAISQTVLDFQNGSNSSRGGLFYDTTNTIFSFVDRNGTPRLSWRETVPRVGINMAVPGVNGLDVSGSLRVSGTLSSVFYADGNTGNVGIGTITVPDALTVMRSSTIPYGPTSSTTTRPAVQGIDPVLYIANNANADNSAAYIAFATKGDSTFTRSTYIGSLSIDGSPLVFGGRSGSTAYAERMRILMSTGGVGIGTTNPLARLDVAGTISASNAIQIGASSLTCGAGIPGAIRYNASTLQFCNGTAWTTLGSAGAAAAASSTGAVQFNAGNALAGDTSNLFWDDTNKRLGIQTATPSAALDVSGSANISGTVKVAGTGNEVCTPGTLGTIRFNPLTGAPQICVQR